MRIALICPPITGRGGMETAIRNLVKGFAAFGDEFHIFGLGESTLDATWHQDLPWTKVGKANGPPIQQLLTLSLQLARSLKNYRADVVITPTASSILIARLAFLWSRRRVPLVSWLHFSLSAIGWKRFLRFADCQVAISQGVANELKSYLGSSQQIATVHNGTNLDVPLVARSDKFSPVEFVYVGRMFVDGQKRVNDILAAASRLNGEFKITMVGGGEDLDRLKEMAQSLGIDSRLTWGGWQAKPWTTLKHADTLLLSSSYEGFPMVLIEAMSRGVPCISSDCEVGPAETIRIGQNGWLFPVGDVTVLASLMQRIIDDRSVLPTQTAVVESVRQFGIGAVTTKFREALVSTIARQVNSTQSTDQLTSLPKADCAQTSDSCE